MKIRSREDVIYLAAKELGLPEDMVKFVIDEFENSLRKDLTHPEDNVNGMVITNLCSWYINPYKLRHLGGRLYTQEYIDNIMNNYNGETQEGKSSS